MANREFTAELKREAVRTARKPCVTKTKVAEELGIHPNLLRRWIEQFDAGKWDATPGADLETAQAREIERLEAVR